MQHAKHAPSSIFRTMLCSAWLLMAAGIEEEETQESREGTATHWVSETVLNEFKARGRVYEVHPDRIVGSEAPNGVIITEEMFDAAMFYVNYFVTLVGEANFKFMHIEQRVDMQQIHAECWGTPDFFWFDHNTGTLHVGDLKYGHLGVHAYMNWQLLAYTLGIINKLKLPGPIKVKFHIVQPRCFDHWGPVRNWEFGVGDGTITFDDAINEMHQRCHEADNADTCTATIGGCRDCPARGTCPTNQKSGAIAIQISEQATPMDMTDNNLAYELDVVDAAIAQLKARKKALDGIAEVRIRQGKRLPGWSLEQGFGNRKWLRDPVEVIGLGAMFGVDLAQPQKPVSVADALKLLKKNKVDESVIKQYYAKTPTSLRLVQDDGLKAKLAFQGVHQ